MTAINKLKTHRCDIGISPGQSPSLGIRLVPKHRAWTRLPSKGNVGISDEGHSLSDHHSSMLKRIRFALRKHAG
jgi:hypothetical protein